MSSIDAPRDDNFVPAALFEIEGSNREVMPGQIDQVTGRILVDSSGGGTGVVIYYTPTGTVNGVNTVFTVASEPSAVVSDGITYFNGFGYTYAALTITMDIPPSQYIRYTK